MLKSFSPASQLAKSITMASIAHESQVDKAGRPYILHALKVMDNLGVIQDDELKSIAVLHDVIEDTSLEVEHLLEAGISLRVVAAVDVLSKKVGQSPEAYLRGILRSHDACRVKVADLKHNMDILRLAGLQEKDFTRLKKYHKMYSIISRMCQWYEDPNTFNLNRSEFIVELLAE